MYFINTRCPASEQCAMHNLFEEHVDIYWQHELILSIISANYMSQNVHLCPHIIHISYYKIYDIGILQHCIIIWIYCQITCFFCGHDYSYFDLNDCCPYFSALFGLLSWPLLWQHNKNILSNNMLFLWPWLQLFWSKWLLPIFFSIIRFTFLTSALAHWKNSAWAGCLSQCVMVIYHRQHSL